MKRVATAFRHCNWRLHSARKRHRRRATLKAIQDRGRSIAASNGTLGRLRPARSAGQLDGIRRRFLPRHCGGDFQRSDQGQVRAADSRQPLHRAAIRRVDVLSRNTTWTMSRDTTLGIDFAAVNYYDGQGFMVRKSLKVNSALELNDASVCVQQGTTTELNLADYFRANHMSLKTVTFATADEAVKAYDTSRCDSYTTDSSGALRRAAAAGQSEREYRAAGNHLQGAAQSGGAPGRRSPGKTSCAGRISRWSMPRSSASTRTTSTTC